MHRIFISSEVQEEITELYQILCAAGTPPTAVLTTPHIAKKLPDLRGAIISTHESRFKNKIIKKIFELFFFLKYIKNYKPTLIFSGFSLFKHRLASKLFDIPHAAYFRGLMFDSENRGGFSDRITYSPIGKLRSFQDLRAYHADLALVTSEISQNFLIERGVARKKTLLCPPIWLSNIRPTAARKERKYYFITQAFFSHGHAKQHQDQLRLIKEIAQAALAFGFDVAVRRHPRDDSDYESLVPSAEVSNSKPEEFLSQTPIDCILITPPSTLAFEWINLGGRCIFYTTDALDEVYANTFKKLKIKPENEQDLLKLISSEDQLQTTPEARVFAHPHPNTYLGELKAWISSSQR